MINLVTKTLQSILLLLIICSSNLFGQKVENLKFYNVQELVEQGQAVLLGQASTMPKGEHYYSRLPKELEGKIRKDVWDLSRNSAGLAIRFSSNSKCIGVKWNLLNNFNMAHMPGTGIRGLDLYTFLEKGKSKAGKKAKGEWVFAAVAQPKGKESANIFVKKMDGSHRDYIMYLPLYDGITSLEIGIDSNAVLLAPKIESLVKRKDSQPIVFYGTSVTQGGCASRPGMAYPAIIERKLGKETINLGFSGNGRMDRLMADQIANTVASAIVIDCLANCTYKIVNDSTEYFVSTIASSHKDIPIYMVSNYCYPTQYLDAQTRDDLEKENILWYELYKKLRAQGFKNLKFLNLSGSKIGSAKNSEQMGGNMRKSATGPDNEGTVDGVHLTDLGFVRLANFYCKALR